MSPGPTEAPVLSLERTSRVGGAANRGGWIRVVRGALLASAVILFGLHFVHLSADFPNFSPWMDWSKYTDEGWYGDAAIRQVQLGHWYIKGDFNPAVALPVWPALEYLLFRMTEVNLVAARALTVVIFGGILAAAFVLVRRCAAGGLQRGADRGTEAAAVAVALLTASPFCFVFTRMAILEPLVVLLALLALLAARRPRRGRIAALGVLVPLMVLTKTTAVFLLPSILWMLWAGCGYRVREFLRAAAAVTAIAGALWSAYYFALVRPRYLEDYRYLFSANAYTGMTRENAWGVIEDTVRHGFWMGRLLYPAALLAVVAALVFWRRCLRNPLVPALMLWAGGYVAFLAYHNNLQPRYYLVIAVPLTILVPMVMEEVWRGMREAQTSRERFDRRALATVPVAVVGLIFLLDARQTMHYVTTPEYTFVQAAERVRKVVMAEKGHSPLVLSISGSDLSLMTGLPSICDDFGTMTLEDRVAAYKPGWYAAWNEVDDDKMDALAPQFQLERVAEFPAYDDPERNLLILYRLDPPREVTQVSKHRKAVPKLLQTRIGQQPTQSQLQH